MIKKLLIAVTFILFLFNQTQFYAQVSSPDFLWAASAGGFAYDNSMDVVTDGSGNIFITGSYDVSAVFGDTTLITETENVFIAKLDANGNFIWVKSVLNFGTIEVVTITLDNSENIIVAGNFSGRFQLESGEELNSFGGIDVFVFKYSPNGALIWLKQFGDADDNFISDISGGSVNNLYFTGYKNLATGGGSQIYTASLDISGNLRWQRSTTGAGFFDRGTGICVNDLNNIFVTGSFGDTKIFNGSNASTTDSIVVANGPTDIFLAKYDFNGNLAWVQNVDNPDFDEGGKIVAQEDILLTGLTSATAGSDVYLAKYSDAGNLIWETRHTYLPYNVYPKINADDAGNISLIFLTSLGENINGGQGEIYFSRFNNQGINLWTTNYGSFDFDDPGDLAVDLNGDIILSGGFTADGFFGDTILFSNQASKDIFVTKVSAPKINSNPGTADFGIVIAGENSQRQILIENNSGTTLYFFNTILTEENEESNYSILSGLPVDSLLPFQSVIVDILFAPQSTGIKNGYLIFETDSPASPDTTYLIGSGILPALTFSDDTLNFGIVDVNNFSDMTLTITNNNSFEIIIDSVTVTDNNQNDFSLINPPQFPLVLSAGGFINLNTRFSPDTPGIKSGNMIITSNSSGSPDIITLMGEGIELITVNFPDSAILGQSTDVIANSPGPAFTLNQFFYRRTGERVYQQSTLTPAGNNFSGNIPSQFSTVRGIQFYIVFSDPIEGTTITYPANNPVNSPASIQVNIPVLDFPLTITSNKYQMLSVPLILSNPELSSVFSDDYGTYNNRVWRLFRWNPSGNSYSEFDNIPDDLLPGNSFWLINRNGLTFDIENAQTVPSNNSYTITIQPGWNQIANPFAFPVSWSDVGNSELLLQLPARWNANTEEYDYDQSVLNPWEGYWVYDSLPQIINLNVPPVESLQGLEKNIYKNFSSNSFVIQIKSKPEFGEMQDYQNYVGMNEYALTGYDRFDIIEAPPVKDDFNLSIVSGGRKFARNIVPYSSEGAYWDFIITSSIHNKNINLYFEEKISIPDNFQIWLLDLDKRHMIPVINMSSIVSLNDKEKVLRLIIGSEEYAKNISENISLVPDEYRLFHNFPNPFNPETTIYFSLKQNSIVTVEIFDILGRRIKKLIDDEEMEAGVKKINWDGTDLFGEKVSSGIYVYRLITNNFTDSKKMILLR